MPIYAYRCEACGFAKDVLQKMSDEPLTVCPSCSKAEFKKQVTAAGFQLKGSGWYVTDFRGGAGATVPPAGAAEPAAPAGTVVTAPATPTAPAAAAASSTAPAAASTGAAGSSSGGTAAAS
ncbi:FmdB family zinc ribbon protein [Collimonas sp.]|jgi:putative FmdB family regulatory protein|uniref:FmdB family zinc ribbon protein n=1 Tax=Collimonas sp. TaxID=1963772 RepID=UPI002B9CC36D|nr:FmdB family zinc ribbon protein [Collimonas sp.]HWX01090.1 FmdB family zinc ribbon protein [Collimonas sp.]